jgi:tetratricopeptide (TPR) repeat protein
LADDPHMRRLVSSLAVLAVLGGCATPSRPPNGYQTLWEAGKAKLRDGDYLAARKSFKELLSRYPDQPENQTVQLYLANCEHQLGNDGEARRIKEKVDREAATPDIKWAANRGLGRLALDREDFREAVSRFQAATAAAAKDPTTPVEEKASLLCLTGVALQGAGRFAEAREFLGKAVEAAPGSLAAKQARAQLLYPDHFAVQTGAFRSVENAEKQRALLAGKGFPAEVIAMDLPQGNLQCVRVGKFRDRAQARALLEKIRASKALPESVKLTIKP